MAIFEKYVIESIDNPINMCIIEVYYIYDKEINMSNMARIGFSNASLPIQTLMQQIKAMEIGVGKEKLDLNPKYQRGAVWASDFKEKLLYSIIVNYPIGSIIIRNLAAPNEKNADKEVVDGQQRLRTIYEFYNGDIELNYELSKKIVNDNKDSYEYDILNGLKNKATKDYQKYQNLKSFKITYESLPTQLQANFNAFNTAIIYLSHQDDTVVAEYFRFVQNQERLRAGEIINSIPASPLEQYLNMIDDKNKLLDVLRWNDTRMEFEKIFYSMIGIFDKRVHLGTQDVHILNYVSNFRGLSDYAQECTTRMIKSLNALSDIIPTTIDRAFNKRLVKFICLLSGFGFVDFTADTVKKLEKVCTINYRISVFSSAQKNAVAKEFKDESPELQDKYRLVAMVGKGSHSFNRAYDRIKVLSEIMSA
jgi:hypothetical protein